MTRAFGGSRPVGPACESDYRAVARGTQYDAVLGGHRTLARPTRPQSHKPLKRSTEQFVEGLRDLGRMA